jgi:SAM-dependent methyltransferase
MILGTASAFLVAMALQKWGGIETNLIWVCLGGGLLAAVLGHLTGLPWWWIPVNFLLPPALYLSLSAAIPAWMYLVCFMVLALLYWNSAGERVPLYLSNPLTWKALAGLVENHPGPFIDVGCGLGGTLFYLSAQYPERRFIGVESAPLPYAFAKLKQRLLNRENVEICYGDFWNLDFSAFQTIYAFLSPAPMAKLYQKMSRELPPGAQFISNSFTVPDSPANETRTLEDSRKTRLLIWRF